VDRASHICKWEGIFLKIMLKRGRERQQNTHPAKQRRLVRINLTVFFMFLGGVLVVCLQFLNPVPAYASTQQNQRSQSVAANVLQMQRSQFSVSCENPQPQDLEACMTQNAPYSDPNYVLPSKTLENPLGTTVDNNGNVQQNVSFFVVTPVYATVDNPTIQKMWGTVLGIVDIFTVILLLLAGLSMIFAGTTFRQSDALELLPAVLLALIVANASMGFMHFFIGLNNMLSGGVYSWADSTLQRTLAGYGRTGIGYDYPQNTYIISLRKGDTEHNAVALYTSKHLQQTAYSADVQVPIYKSKQSIALLPSDIPPQPLDKNHLVGPGYTCKAPGEGDYTTPQEQRIDFGPYGEQPVKNAFQAYHIQADPQKYYDTHKSTDNILGYETVITYHCSLDVALEEKYLPFYPDHINFSIDLVAFFTAGLDKAVVPLVIKVLGAIVYAQMLVRLLLLNFYIVISPLGIACWGLPGRSGQRLTHMWLSGFISLVLVQFLQSVALIITQVMIGAYLGFFHKQLGNEINADLLEQVLGIATLWFTLLIPNLLGTAPMQLLVEAGQEMGQVAGAAMAASMSGSQSMAAGTANIASTIARMIR
jgi:hypothetical protein